MTEAATSSEAPGRSPRSLAISALVAVEGGARANQVLAALLQGAALQRRDRALVTELVYGTCRMRRACDWLASRFLRGRGVERLDPDVRAALRCGAYQLCFTRIPPHAAVAETVAEVSGPARGLVNAVLRRVAESLASGPVSWPDLATELSYPAWMVERLAADLGRAGARQALEAMNRPGVLSMRPDGYAQDLASQMVARHLGARPGELLLDVCASPGGKATAMAAAGAAVIAADVDLGRVRLLARTAAALSDAVLPLAADGRLPPFRGRVFERVLLDAPCSGLGALRRRPDARWRIKPADVARLSALQRSLLAASAALVRPGGLLLYSVCTMTLAETVAVDAWAESHLREWGAARPPGPPWRPAGRGGLILPQDQGTDGMFVLALRAPGRRAAG